ncbi:hypothetical protein [Halocynthiibacter sp.]|uniref:hypothetical protein n=1 Tax=Halocynthiibacter sp. TaxID=1979210 RepID=UPI003C329344
MTITKVKFSLAALSITLLSGCVVENGQYTSGAPRAETVAQVTIAPENIQLLEGAPSVAYQEIQPLSVSVNKLTAFHPTPSEDDARAALRKAAAELGATAVINVEISNPRVTPLSWGARKATGLAVRY